MRYNGTIQCSTGRENLSSDWLEKLSAGKNISLLQAEAKNISRELSMQLQIHGELLKESRIEEANWLLKNMHKTWIWRLKDWEKVLLIALNFHH